MRGTGDIKGETELHGFKVRAGKTVTIIPVLRPSTTWPNLNLQWPDELH